MTRKVWQCNLCTKVFQSQNGYRYHERTHCGMKPYKCDICNTAYTGLKSLTYHNVKNHPEGHLSKPRKKTQEVVKSQKICCKIILTSSKLKYHKNVHSENKLHKCNHCDKMFMYPVHLKNHLRIHTGEQLYKCGVCERSYAYLSSLQYHKITHTRRSTPSYQSKPYSCGDCDKRYCSVYNLKKHQKSHAGKDNGYKSSSRSKAVKHLSLLNSPKVDQVSRKNVSKFISIKKFTNAVVKKSQGRLDVDKTINKPITTGKSGRRCDVCDLVFASTNGLKRHKILHKNVCPKSLTSPNSLKYHGKLREDGQLFQCNVCRKVYKSITGYKYHKDTNGCNKGMMRRSVALKNPKVCQTAQHKPLKCRICQKGFISRNGLRIHTRCHTGDRPYKCDMCAKSYISLGGLKYHKTTHKTNKRSNFSGKTFKQASCLKVPKIDNRKKKYKCELCDKKFRFPGSLTLHKLYHGLEKKQFKCDRCSQTFGVRKELEQHRLKHELEATQPTAVDYVCFQCNASFDLASSLVKHANDTHLAKNT